VDEARRSLTRKLKLNHLQATRKISEFIRSYKVTVVPNVGQPVLSGINAADEPGVRVAASLEIPLVTDDVRLIVECRNSNIAALQPWALVRDFLEPNNIQFACFKPWQVGHREGALFTRFSISGELPVADRLLEVCSVGSSLWVGFVSRSKSWEVKLGSNTVAAIKGATKAGFSNVISVNFERSGSNLKLRLMKYDCDGWGNRPVSIPDWTRPTLPLQDPVKVGTVGVLRDFVLSPNKNSPDKIKKMAAFTDLSPNPLDDDRLKDADLRQAILILPRPAE